MKITRTSPLTGRANTLDLPSPNAAFADWLEGDLPSAWASLKAPRFPQFFCLEDQFLCREEVLKAKKNRLPRGPLRGLDPRPTGCPEDPFSTEERFNLKEIIHDHFISPFPNQRRPSH